MLDKYDFTNSLSVIRGSLTRLLSCSVCLTVCETAWESDQCSHQLCSTCHEDIRSQTCPGTWYIFYLPSLTKYSASSGWL